MSRFGMQKAMKDKCACLLPLFNQFHSNSLRLERAIQHATLPPTSSRYFVVSSQLLSQINLDYSWVLAGCILYKNSVVCTHLDMMTTRWIVNLVEALDEYDVVDRSSSNEHHDDTVYEYPTTVFMKNDVLAKLRASKARISIDNSEDAISTPTTPHANNSNTPQGSNQNQNTNSNNASSMSSNTSKTTLSSPILPQTSKPPDSKKEEDGGEYMGLYIVSLARLSLAVVMNLASLEEDTHLNKIRFLANSKLYSLEKTIHKIQLETAATVSPQQPESALSEGDAEGFNLQNLNALETPQETVYNFLCFNELTENQKAELRLNQTEPKRTFALAINSAHDVFKEDSSVTKLVLRDHTGTVFCSRNFGKENYFHQPSYVDPKIDNSRFEYCEENARRILNLEHNITLI